MNQAEMQTRVLELQKGCKECMASYQKEGISFNPRVCTSYCPYGAELHKLEIQLSDAEKAWDNCDWTSFRLKQFYRG